MKGSGGLLLDSQVCNNIKDDIAIHGQGKEHDARLEALLTRFQEYGLTLRKEKCRFGVPEIKWFGQIFSEQGMSPDPDKVKAIKDWPAPTDKSEVKSFLQTVAFSQEFMRPSNDRTYSDVTAPLRRLTAKSVRFNWDKKCQESFEELKSLLCSDTVMGNYDPDKATRIYVDHGPAGVASTVAQNHGENGTSSWRPIHYQSRALTSAELNYGKVDGESLAVLSGLSSNKMYLYGAT